MRALKFITGHVIFKLQSNLPSENHQYPDVEVRGFLQVAEISQ